MKKIEIIKDSLFEEVHFVKHAFFTRNGGVSKGAFASLNCSYYQDNESNVQENRRRAMDHIGKQYSSLVTFFDMHSNKAVIVDQPNNNQRIINADALVTKNQDVVLGALSADCPLILFAEQESQVIGIAHAGWRGAKAGIIESTMEKMISLGAKTDNMIASIGPCIAQKSYEISMDVYEIFMNSDITNSVYFKTTTKIGHFLFDLRGYVYDKLRKLGIKNLSYLDIDTYQEEEKFFSRRRSYHQSENSYGCQLGVIYFNN